MLICISNGVNLEEIYFSEFCKANGATRAQSDGTGQLDRSCDPKTQIRYW